MKITKWVSVCINGLGEPDFFLAHHNPGYLAHTFRIEVDVPDEIIECVTRKLPCVTLYKMGPESKDCVRGVERDPEIPSEALPPYPALDRSGAQQSREAN